MNKELILFRATEIIWATAKVYLTMRDGHLRPEVFYATNQMKKKPNLDTIVKYLPNTRISSKKYKIDNQVSESTKNVQIQKIYFSLFDIYHMQ